MPRLDASMENHQIGGSNFSFTSPGLKNLTAAEYTLVTIAIDLSGSVSSFAAELLQMLIMVVEACKKSPRLKNLMIRVTTFNSTGLKELHGFKQLSDIDTTQYKPFNPQGGTPLFDAMYADVSAMVDYGSYLMTNDFLNNGILFVITDGEDNGSTYGPATIKKLIMDARQQEKMESLITILIGINAGNCAPALARCSTEAGFDHFREAKDATPGTLAKLAAFVSQSVSSQSQNLGTGGPSQAIPVTI